MENHHMSREIKRREFIKASVSVAAASALGGSSISALAKLPISLTASQQATKPNIVFILMDNLGYGEVGCYGGGELRGAPTPRIPEMQKNADGSIDVYFGPNTPAGKEANWIPTDPRVSSN